jgi:hypothetical protein
MGRDLHWSIMAARNDQHRAATAFLRKPSEHIRTRRENTKRKQDASAVGCGQPAEEAVNPVRPPTRGKS